MTATSFSAEHAKALIKAAIDSESLKLNGPSGNVQNAKERAVADATYLLTLLARLQEPLTP